jgi:hypothetical protein
MRPALHGRPTPPDSHCLPRTVHGQLQSQNGQRAARGNQELLADGRPLRVQPTPARRTRRGVVERVVIQVQPRHHRADRPVRGHSRPGPVAKNRRVRPDLRPQGRAVSVIRTDEHAPTAVRGPPSPNSHEPPRGVHPHACILLDTLCRLVDLELAPRRNDDRRPGSPEVHGLSRIAFAGHSEDSVGEPLLEARVGRPDVHGQMCGFAGFARNRSVPTASKPCGYRHWNTSL